MSDEIVKLRQAWVKAKIAANKASQIELEARAALVRATFDELDEGTQTYQCCDGVDIKITQPYTYKIIITEQDDIENALARVPIHVVSELVKYKPSLSVTAYRQLSQVHKRIVDTILEIKPGTPQVKI